MLIAITGWGQEQDKRRALAAGFDQHLTKPIDPNGLEALLQRAAVERRRRLTAGAELTLGRRKALAARNNWPSVCAMAQNRGHGRRKRIIS